MRSIIAAASLVVLLFAVGCNHSPIRRDLPSGGAAAATTAMPTVENLVTYLNYNAKLLEPTQALNSQNVMIDINAEAGKIGIGAKMICQTPRNFMMSGVALGQPVVDIGSNDKEFWFWSREINPPYLYHCTYEDLARGTKVPFPFQPDMVLSALGLAQYDPAKQYGLSTADDGKGHKSILLTEQARSPENKPIQKITVFDAQQAKPGQPQVLAHILKDERGNVICSANIRSVQQIGPSGLIIPRVIEFSWPDQKMRMKMQIENPRIMAMPPEKAVTVFTRQNVRQQSFDLATQTLDGSGGVRQAGATAPIYRR